MVTSESEPVSRIKRFTISGDSHSRSLSYTTILFAKHVNQLLQH
jgi:hypothetical protein